MISNLKLILLSIFILSGCTEVMPKLGIENGKLQQCPTTANCVSSQAADQGHYIEPLSFTGTQQQAIDHLSNVLQKFDRATIIDKSENYIRAEFVSKVFRFVDDVEFLIKETESKKLIIDVRSASRVGRSDFGINRKRVEKIRDLFLKLQHI